MSILRGCIALGLLSLCTAPVMAQSFRVQCPTSTVTHPAAANNNSEPAYTGPTQFVVGPNGYVVPSTTTVNGAIKCQQIGGGDGYSTMADGTQTYMFSFGPLSGLADIAAGLPGTQFPSVFNTVYPGALQKGDPATTDGATSGASPGTLGSFTYNGAVGLIGDPSILSGQSGGATAAATVTGGLVTDVAITNPGTGCTFSGGTFSGGSYTGPPSVTFSPPPAGGTGALGTATVSGGCITAITVNYTGVGYVAAPSITIGPASNQCLSNTPPAACITGHVDPRPIIDVGVMNGNIPAPLLAFDEDDEVFFTLSNVGMIMRPDLFEQHTVHFHGYPNASSFYDGVPDASVAINIGASFTYYYLSPDAGTYFWHCHITPPEHLQMGMVGQLFVRPRQDRVPVGGSLYTYLGYQNGIEPNATTVADLRTACNPNADILCSASTPAVNTGATQQLDTKVIDPANGKLDLPQKYVYNDGDGSTQYDVEYPIQMHGFDPNFHFVGMTFNPEMFVDMKDKYFLLNGRSYPDTVGACGGTVANCAPGPQATVSSDTQMHYSQPMPALVNIPVGGKASLRLVNLSVSEYHTLASLGIPMKVVGWNAKLLRDQAGNNTEYFTNSITLGGGESLDVILDASDASCGSSGCAAQLYPAGSVFYIFSPQLDHLSNDAENFGGEMTEVHICNTVTGTTYGNTCT
jgi:FtsP/CotA-like multicopper oxidase with cupredoxin domain